MKKYFSDKKLYTDFDGNKAVSDLSKLVSFETISYSDESRMNKGEFVAAIEFLKETYPLCSEKLEWTVINEMSLLLKLPGDDKKGVMLMAHMDVVPVNEESLGDWKFPPFSGTVDGNFIYGRGANDTKNSLIASLSAMEYHLAHGFVPKKDIYFAFGHDEETLGGRGNAAISDMLKKQGVTLDFVFDEGGGFKMGDDYFAPSTLIANINICEKGYTDITVTAKNEGGHSSQPGKGTSLGAVCKALGKIEDNGLKPSVNEVLKEFFIGLSPYVEDETYKKYFSDPKKYEAEIIAFMEEKKHLDPLVKTTTAVNMISGSPAPNVLPQIVTGLINFRNGPGDSCQDILKHCIEVSGDTTLDIKIERGVDPSEIANINSNGYNAIKETIGVFFPEAVVLPSISVGGTDARFYEQICNACIRFKPYLELGDPPGNEHRTDENTRVDAHITACKFYCYLIEHYC